MDVLLQEARSGVARTLGFQWRLQLKDLTVGDSVASISQPASQPGVRVTPVLGWNHITADFEHQTSH